MNLDTWQLYVILQLDQVRFVTACILLCSGMGVVIMVLINEITVVIKPFWIRLYLITFLISWLMALALPSTDNAYILLKHQEPDAELIVPYELPASSQTFPVFDSGSYESATKL